MNFLKGWMKGDRRRSTSPEGDANHDDLAVNHLRRLYSCYKVNYNPHNPKDNCEDLYNILPVFYNAFNKAEQAGIASRFPELVEFSNDVSAVFVVTVVDLARGGSTQMTALTILRYFDVIDKPDKPAVGWNFLRTFHILSGGSPVLIKEMMKHNLCAVIVRILKIFLDLPPPKLTSPSVAFEYTPRGKRVTLQKLLSSILSRLLKHNECSEDLIKKGDIKYVFSAISSPCPLHNKIWRKANSELLVQLCRHSLSNEVINFIHSQGCTQTCVRRISESVQQVTPLESVEMLVALFCLLKDSSEISQVILGDFASGGGYKFIYDYLLFLERKNDEEAKEALRNVVLLVQSLTMCGFLDLAPSLTDGGPFQDEEFEVPVPTGNGMSVKNIDAFSVLQNSFLKSSTTHLGLTIVDIILNIYSSDHANYFILDSLHTLPLFIEALPYKDTIVQERVFKLLEYVVCTLNYVPTAEYASLCLVLQNKVNMITQAHALNLLIKFVSFSAKHKNIFREVGLLSILTNCLQMLCKELSDAAEGDSRKFETQLSQPYEETLSSSTHTDDIGDGGKEAADAEYSILLMECLRVLIEDNVANGMLFKESDGVKVLLKLISFTQSRQMALKLMIQLILLEGGSDYMHQLLTHINILPPVAVGAKIDILKMLLRCFQLDSCTKNMFREVGGFGVLISVLASLYGSLLDNRTPPWSEVSRDNVLALVRLVFTTLSDAMEDNPANRRHFDNNIKFESFSDPLRSLGCFCSDMKTIMPYIQMFQHTKHLLTNFQRSESLAWFNAEFKLFDPPSSKLSKSSSLHAAAEIFRFLRDMALGIPDADSEPLILDNCIEILSPSYLGKYLIHPGATICMVDLLPAVHWTCYRVVGSCDISGDVTIEMSDTEVEIRNWCEYLQGRVVAELYMLASGNRNQQCMCQVGLPGRLLLRCKEALANENHALHHPLQRTFERLSCQALTPADFRNFLRLGDPLNCKLDELQSPDYITSQNSDKLDVITESEESENSSLVKNELNNLKDKHSFGNKLSVAKIQSLVSMASLRRGGLGGTRDCPPFVEFDMSIGGFAYLFFPSVFPYISSSQSTTSIIHSNTEKGFPPVNGLAFSTWLCIERCNLSEDNDPIISLLSLFATYKLPSKKRHSFTCMEIFLCPKDKTLVVSTQQHKFRSRLGSQSEETGFVRRREKSKDAVYECPILFDEGRWHHVAVVLQKIVLRGCMASLHLDGTLVKSQKLSYISPFNASSNDPDNQAMIHGLIGTPATRRSIAPVVFQLGPTHLIAEPLSSVHIQQMYTLGPNYVGSFQAISLNEGPADTMMDQSKPMEPLLAEEKIVFGLLASQTSVVSMKEMSHMASMQECRAIAKEVSVSVEDEVTPLTILNNTALHLGGPPRTAGAVMIGLSGIRTFVPQPLRALLSSVGGTSVMLGLVAMANTVECLYASVKALDCTVGGNPSALKEMEQTGGFQILGMLFRSKSHLLNSHILHLSFSLVGSQDSQCMLATIPNPVAFRDLLADLSIWSHTSEDLQKMLFDHFCDLLCHSSEWNTNRQHMLDMNLVPLILHRLTDHKLDKTTICKMGNVLAELLKNIPKKSDLKRLGHLLVTTLPEDYSVDENGVFIYCLSPPISPVDRTGCKHGSYGNWGYPDDIQMSKGADERELKKIRLRNMLLELLNSLLTDDKLEFDPKVAQAIHSVLGFDWLMLFLHPHIHRETVNRAFRILVQLLSDQNQLNKFRDGNLGCRWLKEAQGYLFELVPQMNQYFHLKFHSILSPGKEQGWKELKAFCSLPGFCLLNNLLPKHKESPQVYLLVIALLLGKSVFDVPNNAPFNLESLDSIFQMSSMEHKLKVNLCMDAVYILLTITRVLLHPDVDSEFGQDAALVIIKFLERVYRDVPQFAKMATQPEFVESLVATLFPPITVKTTVDEAIDAAAAVANAKTPEEDEDGFLVIPPTATASNEPPEAPSTLLLSNNPTIVSIIKLLRTILIDGLATTSIKPPVIHCPIIDQVLDAYPSLTSMVQQKQYQTVVINSAMEYLKNGAEDIILLFKDRSTMDKSLAGVGVFCARVVDRIWQGCYLDSASNMFDFLFHLLGQAKDKSQVVPLSEIQKALHRLILYQLSPTKLTSADCTALVDILCSLATKLDDILDPLNNDEEFLACLFYCLYHLAEERSQENFSPSPGANSFTGYVPASWIQMKSAANRVFCRMLELKRKNMEEIFHVQFTTRSGSISSEDDSMSGVTGISGGAMRNYSKLQHCKDFMGDALAKRYEAYVSLENSSKERITSITPQRKSFALFGPRRSTKEIGGRSRNLLVLAQEYVEYHTQSFIKAVHQLDALLLRKYQRNQEYKLRFTASEWARTADELTRERGLWGPLNPCYLDKWALDSVEGPMRMRKRLYYNDKFYAHYPFRDSFQLAKFSQKHKPPCSLDSELYQKLVVQLKRSPIVSPLRLVCSSHGGTSGGHHSNNEDELHLSVEYGAENSTPGTGITDIETVSSEEVDLVSSLEVGNPVSLALSRMLEPEDKIQMKIQCARLEGLDSKEGLLLLGTTHFYVIEGMTLTKNGEIADLENLAINEYDPVVPMELAQYSSDDSQDIVMPPIKCMKWHYDTIQEVHKRRYLLKECALEVFNNDGRSHFLIFEINRKNKVYTKLTNLAKSMLSDTSEDLKAGVKHDADLEASAGLFSSFNREKTITQKWEDGEITNFQYLMHLNTLAGRSYNDLMQYPIFPWILADYTSEVLDLTNPATFRDLTKPMGAQTDGRLASFLERYQHLEDPGPTGEGCHKYLYGTHYSSAMIVASYLIRMEPFTQFFLKLQGGNFDIPDRLFHSIHEAWRSASEVNMADIKELIPEFFYLSDFLTNDNRFILGMKQNGETLNNIALPPWAKGDPREFIRMHREALECDYVSAHLHEWIDLIFGYKQQGQPSLEANNLFHPLFYEGAVDFDKLTDPVKRKATVGFINNFGQMPKQIFKRPHKQRKVKLTDVNEASSSLSSVSAEHSKLFYKSVLGTLKEPIKEFRGKVGQIVSTGDKYLAAVEENKVLLPPLYNRYFAWGFPDCSAKIGTLEQDKTISVYEGLHQGHIRCAAAVNEYTLLTAGDVPVVCVWLMKTTGTKEKAPTQLTLKKTLHGHSAPVSCLSYSSSYSLIVSGSQDCTCILWDLSKLIFLRQLQCRDGPITAICINELTGDIATCAKQYLYMWNVNGHLLASTRVSSSSHVSINCCIMSELISWDKDNVIVTGSSDGVVRMHKMELVRKKYSKSSVSPSADISNRQFSADSQVIADQIDEVFIAQHSSVSVGEETADNDGVVASRSEARLSTEDSSADQQDEVKWHRKLVQTVKLTLHTCFTREDNTAPAEITAFCISKDHKKLFVGDSRGRIYAWSSVETTGKMADHWIKDEVADKCSKCKILFSFTERKHHCRDCGNIFCSKCSGYESVVLRIQVKKRVRVCEDCYYKNQEMATL